MGFDYNEIIRNRYFVDPTFSGYGTIPSFVEARTSKMAVKPYDGGRPDWEPSTEDIREYLMANYWGREYASRSLKWIIGHNGSPLSEDSIQIDHIVKWKEIEEKLLYQYNGKNAKGTPFDELTTLPHPDGKLIKGIDYIDDPDILSAFGEDVLYRFTNVGAIRYFHTIENLRPLPGSINSRRNNSKLSDSDLKIIHPLNISQNLMRKLAELSAKVEEYTSQVVHLTGTFDDNNERHIHIEMFIEKTDELISHLSEVNKTEFL